MTHDLSDCTGLSLLTLQHYSKIFIKEIPAISWCVATLVN